MNTEVLAFVSRVRTCPDACPSCRAEAAALLGEPTVTCLDCGFPTLDGSCPCARFKGQPSNPAAQRFHEQSKGQAA